MSQIDLEVFREYVRGMNFERGTPEQIAFWREDIADARASLVIENTVPTDEDDAMFAIMLDEGVPPSLMASIILGLYTPGTYSVAG